MTRRALTALAVLVAAHDLAARRRAAAAEELTRQLLRSVSVEYAARIRAVRRERGVAARVAARAGLSPAQVTDFCAWYAGQDHADPAAVEAGLTVWSWLRTGRTAPVG